MAAPHPRPRPALAVELVQPWPLAALFLLLVNDHLLKGAGIVPAWLTGKLSDFAGLFLFPIVLFVCADAVSRLAHRPMHRARVARFASALTALVFAGLKLHPALNAAANAFWGSVVLDASDTLALPMCVASWRYLEAARWQAAQPRAVGLRAAVAALASVACIATSPPSAARNYPVWQLLDAKPRAAGCASIESWVSKSGKQGVGITVRVLAADDRACALHFESAHFEIEGQNVNARALPADAALTRAPQHVYLGFAFDNEASWNRDQRHAVLALQFVAGDERVRMRSRLFHRWDAPHWREPWPHAAPLASDLRTSAASTAKDGGVP